RSCTQTRWPSAVSRTSHSSPSAPASSAFTYAPRVCSAFSKLAPRWATTWSGGTDGAIPSIVATESVVLADPATHFNGPVGAVRPSPHRGTTTCMAMHSESTTKTYLYLRVGLVALAVFLGTSLVIELAFGDTEWQGSISAYYYTPVRSVFVGTLTA